MRAVRGVMVAALIVMVAAGLCAHGGERIALVIGNGDYATLGKLANPPNDATDIAAELTRIGFDVELLINEDLEAMEEAVIRFGRRLSGKRDATGFFFFAGHGVQSGGENYLVPAQASIGSESFLRTRSISAQIVLDEMQRAGNRLNVVVLDACRDNPFSWGRSGTRGLVAVAQQPPGSIVAYATGAGSVAGDGEGRNGVFTAELLRHIGTPGIDVSEVFRRTGLGVQNVTNSRQVPAVYSQFFGAAYLAAGPPEALIRPGQVPAGEAATALPVPSRPALQVDRGSVRVTTQAQAELLVDGVAKTRSVAGSSMVVSDIEVGSRRFTARYADGHEESRTVTVSATMVSEISFEYAFGSIRVVTATAGTVLLDGVELGALDAGQSATIPDVGAGTRSVELQYAGGRSETQRVTVAANRTAEASFAGLGSLRVSAVTAGTVFVDGTERGTAAAGGTVMVGDVAAGSRRVEIRYEDRQSETESVSVIAGQGATATFTYHPATAGQTLRVGQEWTSPAGIKFKEAPGGSFQKGTASGIRDDERPVRTITLTGFWMTATEVTQGQWQAVMGSNPSATDRGIGANNPVNRVSWYDAIVFCNRLSTREGRTPVYSIAGSTDPSRWGAIPPDRNSTWDAVVMNRSADGYRLPTEAEWEYAAKGGPVSRDSTYAGGNDLNSVAWHSGNSGSRTQSVGTKAPNELGFYDMSGNVWEWVWDWYGTYPNQGQTDPTGPAGASNRVLRGGSWDSSNPSIFRPAYRFSSLPWSRSYGNGFRLLVSQAR